MRRQFNILEVLTLALVTTAVAALTYYAGYVDGWYFGLEHVYQRACQPMFTEVIPYGEFDEQRRNYGRGEL